MSFFKRLNWIVVLLSGLFLATNAFSEPKTLIEYEGGKASAGLAKSWKKVKDGEYEFVLNTALEIKKGTPVSPAAVKDALEARLGSTFNCKVTPKGADTVSVTYSGDEQKFLEKVSKTKIRGEKNVELALESSVSDGSIRAKTADREPNANEVKGIVIKVEGDIATVKVNATKSAKIKDGSSIKVKSSGVALKVSDSVFFIPEKEAKGVWTPKAGSLQ